MSKGDCRRSLCTRWRGRGKKGGVVEGDAISKGVEGNGRVGGMCCRRLVCGEIAVLRVFGVRQVELPEAGGGSAGAVENGKVVASRDGNGVGGECGCAAVVAKCADGDERAGGEGGKDVCLTGLRWKVRDV
jgi:hypothetical protein